MQINPLRLMAVILPSGGISGTVLVTLALESRNIARPVTIAALFIGLVSFNAAYLIVVIGACVLLWLHGLANPSLLALVTVFSVGVVAIPAVLIWMKRLMPIAAFSWTEYLPGLKALRTAVAKAPTRMLRDKGLIIEAIYFVSSVCFSSMPPRYGWRCRRPACRRPFGFHFPPS